MIKVVNVDSKVFIINKYKIVFFEARDLHTRIVMQEGTSIMIAVPIADIIDYLKSQPLISL